MFYKILVFTFILSLFFSIPVSAVSLQDEYSKQVEISGANEIVDYIPNDVLDVLHNLGLDINNQKFDVDFDYFLKTILNYISSYLTSPLTTLGVISTVLMICYLFSTLTVNEKQQEIISYISAVIMCSCAVFPISELLIKTQNAITLCCGFNLVLIPIYSGILIASGSFKSLETINILFIFSQGIEIFITSFFSPLVGIYTSLSISGSLSSLNKFSNITSSFKRIIDWILGISVTLYMAVLAITGTISSLSDSITQRMGKFVIGSTVPIIGGVISDSLSTILGATKYLKSGLGLYAVCTLVIMLLPTIIEITLWRFALTLASFVADITDQNNASSLIKSISNGVGIIFSVIISAFIVFLFSMVIVVMGGGGI